MKTRETPLGIELKKQREKQGINLRELANMIGRNRGYLSQIELGTKKPGPKILEEIAGALDINRNLLLRHINLLKMEFIRPSLHEEKRDPLDGLTPEEMDKVLNYIDYLKYERETWSMENETRHKQTIQTGLSQYKNGA